MEGEEEGGGGKVGSASKGTNIIPDFFTQSELYDDIREFLFFFECCLLFNTCESITASMFFLS